LKIAVGSDHVGFPLKQAVIAQLAKNGVDVVDVGTYNSEEPVDYPDYAFQVDKMVANHACDRGVLICGTGLGMSIAANKVPGVRAALCDDAFSARLSRAHNDANVLCMGANVVTPARAEWIVKEWLETPFDHGRHVARLSKLDQAFGLRGFALEELSHSCHLSWDQFAVALSPRRTVFGPVLFADRFLEGLQAAAQVGFQKIEISLRHPDDFPNKELDNILSQSGLGLSAIATGQSCLHDDLCLCSPSSDLCQMTVDSLKAYMHIGKRLGSVVIIGGIRGRLTGSVQEMNEQRQRAIAAIRDCAAYARELGVPLVLECINRYETNFICSVDEGLAALDEVGDPDLKLLLDTFHMNIEEPDIVESIQKVAGRLGYIHFSDSNRQAPGCGHIDFIRVLDTLKSIGYTGTISTEVLPIPDDSTALNKVAEFFRSLVATQ
jgi:RpiB/LacA/LacB family sugar-phosphate isomerase